MENEYTPITKMAAREAINTGLPELPDWAKTLTDSKGHFPAPGFLWILEEPYWKMVAEGREEEWHRNSWAEFAEGMKQFSSKERKQT